MMQECTKMWSMMWFPNLIKKYFFKYVSRHLQCTTTVLILMFYANASFDQMNGGPTANCCLTR